MFNTAAVAPPATVENDDAAALPADGGIDPDGPEPPPRQRRKPKPKQPRLTRSQLSKNVSNKRNRKGKAVEKNPPLPEDGGGNLLMVDVDDIFGELPEVSASSSQATSGGHDQHLNTTGKKKERVHRKRTNATIPNTSRSEARRTSFCPSLEDTMAGLRSNTFCYTQTNAGGKWRKERMKNASGWAPSAATDESNKPAIWDEEAGWELARGKKSRMPERIEEEDFDEDEVDEYGMLLLIYVRCCSLTLVKMTMSGIPRSECFWLYRSAMSFCSPALLLSLSESRTRCRLTCDSLPLAFPHTQATDHDACHDAAMRHCSHHLARRVAWVDFDSD